MSEKRYQVFVSSTFTDLVAERQAVVSALIESDCFPAGMEAFAASDESQWEMIKKYIDESDYYIVLSAGKYGSIDTDTNISFTEKEYRYAISTGKPVAAFIHSDLSILAAKHTESSLDGKKMLEQFHQELKKSKVVKFWSSKDELKSQIILSMLRLKRERPTVGWVRADKVATTEILEDINELRKENDRLNGLVDLFRAAESTLNPEYAWDYDLHVVTGFITESDNFDLLSEWEAKMKWRSIFSLIGSELRHGVALSFEEINQRFSEIVVSSIDSLKMDDGAPAIILKNQSSAFDPSKLGYTVYSAKCFLTALTSILSQFEIHGLIRLDNGLYSLTNFGHRHFIEMSAVKRT